MTRWSLSNRFRSVSHQQFLDYAKQFKQAAEQAFGTECTVKATVLREPKVYTTFLDDDIQDGLDYLNEKATLLKTDDLSEVTAALWDKAGYVEMVVHPKDETQAPQAAFGHAEFKGRLRRQATFYMQGGDHCEDAAAEMIRQNRGKSVGDGYRSNGAQSGAIPASVIDLFKP